MCGIAGVAGSIDRNDSRSCISHMLRELWRRGPDDARLATWSDAILGSRRLAVFDPTDNGNQPMVSADRKVGIVFNGAIYNFRELRARLIALGSVFSSETDTEVILNGYIQWGLDVLLENLDGMFAFALWDAGSKKLLLVRDRLGVKPLVYARRGNRLYFASTIDALRAGGVVDRTAIDAESVLSYLNWGFVPDSHCIYEDVSKVAAGTVVEWCDGKLGTKRYWEPRFSSNSPMDFPEAVEATERLLLNATEKRLNADVPVGALLSGGIDSGLVCWAASRLGADIPTFTLGVEGDSSDEAQAAGRTAKKLRLKNILVAYTPEGPELADLLSAWCEPFACSSSLGMLRLCEAASDSVTVLLTGEGGDEAFLGYPAYLRYRASERVAQLLPATVQQLWRKTRHMVPTKGIVRRPAHMMDFVSSGVEGIAESQNLLPWFTEHGVLGERLKPTMARRQEVPGRDESGRDLIRNFQTWHFENRFLGEYMTKVDGSSMFHSIEARSPFLDLPLWTFANNLQPEVRLAGGELKSILRTIARRRIGPEVGNRVKRGFTVPIEKWLTGKRNSQFSELFADSVLAREGWICGESVRKQFDRAQRNGDASLELWHLFVLENWFRQVGNAGADTSRAEYAIPEICCSSN